MKLAAIDIGSNAVRLQIVNVIQEEDKSISFKKLEFLRYPLRLGKIVFKEKAITGEYRTKFLKIMQTFSLMIELYSVDHYSAVATSAMREASNGKELVDEVKKEFGLDIRIIPGAKEAQILNMAIKPFLLPSQMIHIDVGGGSTEINYYDDMELKASKSFKIGTIRTLSSRQSKAVYNNIEKWVNESEVIRNDDIITIGTGGNINRVSKISMRPDSKSLSLVELKALRAYLDAFTLEDRITRLKLNPDRADVIVPACDIYINVMQSVGADKVIVPRVGLKDGLIYQLYCKVAKCKETDFSYNQQF